MTRREEEETENSIWRARYGEDAHVLPLDMLEPYTKVLNEDHYNRVIASLELEGLRNPLVILIVDEDEWHQQFVKSQGDILPPSTFGLPLRHRVQCGNHRYWALKHHFNAEFVSCEVYDDPEKAKQACLKYRRNKSWKDLSLESII